MPFSSGLCLIVMCTAWILFLGLKVLGPQEALVLTLFGKYVGTLKGEGFYFVNPFCVAVNPARATQLNQSGDVTTIQAVPAVSKEGSINLPMLSKDDFAISAAALVPAHHSPV